MAAASWFPSKPLGSFQKYADPICNALDFKHPRDRFRIKDFYLLNLTTDPIFPDQGAFKKVFFCVTLGLIAGEFTVHVALASKIDCVVFKKEKRVLTLLKGVSETLQPLLIEQEGPFEYMITDLFNQGSLFDFLEKEICPYGDPILDLMAYQIVCAVRQCHARGVILRDLKLENILVDQVGYNSFKVCLIDFGLAFIVAEDDESESLATCGSPHYICPETVIEIKTAHRALPADPARDAWALGVVLHAMANGNLPGEEQKVGNAVLGISLFPEVKWPLGTFGNEIKDLLYSKRANRPSLHSIEDRMRVILSQTAKNESFSFWLCQKVYRAVVDCLWPS